jgi:hypothetical protein
MVECFQLSITNGQDEYNMLHKKEDEKSDILRQEADYYIKQFDELTKK